MAKPLDGIQVLELGNFIAGPFCGTLLADMGADVIKIEPPSGDMARAMPPIVSGESATFVALNRNKRSIVLDLKRPEAQEIVRKLAAKADVLLENSRPGALDRMGLGAEAIRAINPSIVYTSVSGFGQTGPNKSRSAVNLIIEAASGTLSVNGHPGEMPLRSGVQTGDMFGALFATYATLAGLVGAARHKDGRTIDVSLVESSIAAAAWETASYLTDGEVPQPLGHRHRLSAPYQLFATRDGRYVAIGAPNTGLFRRLMDTLGLSEHNDDPRLATYASRKENEDFVVGLVEKAMLDREAADIESALVQEGVPCTIVNGFDDILSDPHTQARGVVIEIDHPKLGRMKSVRNPVLLDRDGPEVTRPAPLLGEHSAEILSSVGYGPDAIEALVRDGVTRLGGPVLATLAAE